MIRKMSWTHRYHIFIIHASGAGLAHREKPRMKALVVNALGGAFDLEDIDIAALALNGFVNRVVVTSF